MVPPENVKAGCEEKGRREGDGRCSRTSARVLHRRTCSWRRMMSVSVKEHDLRTTSRNLKPKAILLDYFGTVVEDIDWFIEKIASQVASACPRDVMPTDVNALWYREFFDLLSWSFGDAFTDITELNRRSLARVIEHFGADLDAAQLLDGQSKAWAMSPAFAETTTVLDRCQLPICVASNIDNAELKASLGYHGFDFDGVVTSESARSYKPRPEVFQAALSVLGVHAREALFVGDALGSDVRGAKALGIPVLWINRKGRTSPSGCATPDHVASDLTGLLRFACRF